MSMNYHFLYQSKLLETFKALITILESKNLNYFACGGTALGAVRHKNIIPWDDDIDIFMPRKDYMELLGLAQGIKEGYEILSINDHGGRATYMKFVNIQTSYWEIENCPTMSGLFIDIFPLDYYDGDIESFVKKWSQLKNLSRLLFLSNSKFSLSYLIKNIGSEDKKMYWSNLLSLFVPGFLCGFIRERIRQFDKNILYNSKTNTMVCYYGSYGKKEYFEACWFDNYVDCQYAE